MEATPDAGRPSPAHADDASENRSIWPVLLVLMVAEVAANGPLMMVNPALGAWLRMFRDPVHVGWILSSFLLVCAVSAALCGRLGDIFGRKRVLVTVLGIASLGSLIGFAKQDLGWIITGRVLQGVCGAVLPLCYGLVRENMPTRRVPFAIGVIVATASFASAASALVGGVLTDHFGPQSIFAALAIMCFIPMIIVAIALPGSSGKPIEGRFDWLGALLFAPAIAAILLSISNARRLGWTDSGTLTLMIGGITVIALWLWHERRTAQPFFDLQLFARREAAIAYLSMFCISISTMQLMEMASLLFQQPVSVGPGLGTSATLVGIIALPVLGCGMLSSLWAGWIAGRRGPRLPMVVGGVFLVAAMVLACIDHSSITIVVIAMSISATGMTAVYTGIPAVLIAAVPAERVGEATGMMALIRAMTQGIGSQLVAIMLASSVIRGPNGANYPSDGAYTLVFFYLLLGGLTALALALSLGVKPGVRGATPSLSSSA